MALDQLLDAAEMSTWAWAGGEELMPIQDGYTSITIIVSLSEGDFSNNVA